MKLKNFSLFGRLPPVIGWVFFIAGFSLASAQTPALENEVGPYENAAIITSLELEDYAPGLHYLQFQAGARNTGAPIWVPVIVMVGEAPGPRLLLTSAVHGDELNGISVIHGLLERIDPSRLKGTIVAVPGVNQPGMNANSRHFVSAGGGGSMTDLNRTFPGRVDGGSAAERYVAMLWQKLFRGNVDYAVDLHTQTRGSAYPLFVFADFRNETSRSMAHDLMPDLIKNDAGQKGTLETTFVASGVPAVTLEVGGPKKWQHDLIARATGGVENMMVGIGMLEGEKKQAEKAPFIGSNATNIYTDVGGFAYMHVKLLDRVAKGQRVATMVDAFGRETARYWSQHDGIVLSIATDPLREPGAMLVRILH